MQWAVLVPMKALPRAKSRLAASLAPGADHARLVTAIRRDTLRTVLRTADVAEVLIVVDAAGVLAQLLPATDCSPDTAPPVTEFVQRRPGLNAGLAEAATALARRRPLLGVAALVGDLPALRPADLAAALTAAAARPRAFVPDHTGTGTTLLAAAPGRPLQPRFGARSALRHAADADALPADARLRLDIDTAEDLFASVPLGVGSATSAELDATAGREQRDAPAAVAVAEHLGGEQAEGRTCTSPEPDGGADTHRSPIRCMMNR